MNNLNIEQIRYNPTERNAFLAMLARQNRRKICAIVRDARRATFDFDDAVQAFLIGANLALDTARTEDDGRGGNDPQAYCAWKGMLAVREAMRSVRGRSDRPCIKQHAQARTVYTGALWDVIDDNDGASLYFAERIDYADEACANIDFTNFLAKLRGIDKEAALLLVYGETDTRELVCICTASKHSYIDDLAHALGCKASRVFHILHRLRDGARELASA